MQPLSKELRSIFERTVIRARDVSEAAARIAIEQLGVEQAVPYPYLTENQRELRRKLRLHGRQLGDELDSQTDKQEIKRLIEEVAYEHWHRMLFARFLAENNLLMYFEDNDIQNAVSVTLSECEELATELKYKNGWALAASLAAKMLPQIFRANSPVFEVVFSPENQKELEVLLLSLDKETFLASDGLGWAYQFWQSKKKDFINLSGNKIGASDLPSVTQLFTEPYMVKFLLDNSIGAWWANKKLSSKDFLNASCSEDLRKKIEISNIDFSYTKFIKNKNVGWITASGDFHEWPENLSNFKLIDPCCGSGHFLVSSFLMLVPLRMELENLSAQQSCDLVLRENLHGLEIDQRCVELAAFAIALEAWRYKDAGGYRKLPELQIAWCGQSINVKKEEWIALADGDSDLNMHLDVLYNLFKSAPIIGSLINPQHLFKEGTLFYKDLNKIYNKMNKKIERKNDNYNELGVIAHGVEKAFQLLTITYDLVITNPPYLGERKQDAELRNYIQKFYNDGKADLATAFILRGEEYLKKGTQCLVLPQNWLYQKSYQALRERLLNSRRVKIICQIGGKAFNTSVGADIVLLVLNDTDTQVYGIDATCCDSIPTKMNHIKNVELSNYSSERFLSNPEARIILQEIDNRIPMLEEYSNSYAGILNGDTERFVFKFWEINDFIKWEFIQNAVKKTEFFGGKDSVILWENEQGELKRLATLLKERLHNADRRGNQAWGKKGIVISQMGDLYCTLYNGTKFNQNCAVIIPKDEKNLPAIWAFCASDSYNSEIRKIDKKKNITNATLVKVPFDKDYWCKIADEKYGNRLPSQYSNNPTQWVFHGYPADSIAPLQVAVARLLGYKWPSEITSIDNLSEETKEFIKKCNDLNRFIDYDGIVCINAIRGELGAGDRLLNLLAHVYVGDNINNKISELLSECGHAGISLESWLRNKFFTQHIKLFDNRPFIWHIWDGLNDGFSALLNYHKLSKKSLETLIYTYLGDWINRQKSDVANRVQGSDERLAAAENLKICLEQILIGESPLDIFVRWKSIQEQAEGWDPDINDGVRINIRPFMSVMDVGKKGAGILRDRPNIKWDKDRGKDHESSFWYERHKGERINDYHLSLFDKKKAREELRCDVSESNTSFNKFD